MTEITKLTPQDQSTELLLYTTPEGEVKVEVFLHNENLWLTQKRIAELFGVDRTVITKHLQNIFESKELEEKSTCVKIAQVEIEGKRKIKRKIKFYNLDAILSVGYRVSSFQATQFRIWAIKILKEHISKGYTINEKVLQKNHEGFLKAVEYIKSLTSNQQIYSDDVLELIKTFSSTWFSLESYDKQNFPKQGEKKSNNEIVLDDLTQDLYSKIEILRQDLIKKKGATGFFAQENKKGALGGILGNVFQSIFGQDVYETVEEKASHLLYFIIKDHPFTDGNKRTGAFSFIWFLQKMSFDFRKKISPETLTALTLFIAESKPKDKEKMIGLILLLLQS